MPTLYYGRVISSNLSRVIQIVCHPNNSKVLLLIGTIAVSSLEAYYMVQSQSSQQRLYTILYTLRRNETKLVRSHLQAESSYLFTVAMRERYFRCPLVKVSVSVKTGLGWSGQAQPYQEKRCPGYGLIYQLSIRCDTKQAMIIVFL